VPGEVYNLALTPIPLVTPIPLDPNSSVLTSDIRDYGKIKGLTIERYEV